jgi:general secretion pathway protein K
MKHPREQAGFALLAALGLVTVLSLTALSHWQSTAAAQQRYWLAGEEARAVARIEAGSAIVLASLAANAAAGAPPATRALEPGLERRFTDGGLLRCLTRDESARLNVNALIDPRGNLPPAHRAAFVALFDAVGIAASAVDALADRLDSDDEARGPWGAEAAWYRDHRPGHEHRNGPMSTLDELAAVRGFPPDAGQRLGEWLTVLPEGARLNINTAAPELLEHLDPAFTGGRVAALLAARPFADLSAWRGWAAGADLPPLTGLLDVRSRHHAIECRYHSAGARAGEALRVETGTDGSLRFAGRQRLAPGGH